jgi:hypothetical protein
MKQDLGKTGNAPIVKVGHTNSGYLGSEPMAQPKGVASVKPTEQQFK